MSYKDTALVFVGQGTQYPGMSKELNNPSATEVYRLSREILGFYRAEMSLNSQLQRINRTRVQYSNLSIFITNHAFYESLKSALPNLVYHAAVGHSVGLFNAVVASEAVDYEYALLLLQRGSQYTHNISRKVRGGLAIIRIKNGVDRDSLLEKLEEKGIFAALINAPGRIVLGGPRSKLKSAIKEFDPEKVIARNIYFANVPFHTPYMTPVADYLRQQVDPKKIKRARVPLVSSSTGHFIVDPEHILEEILTSIDNPVEWVRAVSRMAELGIKRYIVLGSDSNELIGNTVRRIIPNDEENEILVINNQESLEKVVKMLTPQYSPAMLEKTPAHH